jgi:hypothetical protein
VAFLVFNQKIRQYFSLLAGNLPTRRRGEIKSGRRQIPVLAAGDMQEAEDPKTGTPRVSGVQKKNARVSRLSLVRWADFGSNLGNIRSRESGAKGQGGHASQTSCEQIPRSGAALRHRI